MDSNGALVKSTRYVRALHTTETRSTVRHGCRCSEKPTPRGLCFGVFLCLSGIHRLSPVPGIVIVDHWPEPCNSGIAISG
jgi:hypothetical protein